MADPFDFVQRVFFFSLGAVMYALVGILPQLSRGENRELEYDNVVTVALAESGKLLISIGFLTEWGRNVRAIGENWHAFKKVVLYFSVPAFLYAVANNLDIVLALYMDAATFQVFMQSKIASTSILWWVVFRKKLLVRQWAAIAILTGGSALCSIQKADTGVSMGITDVLGIPLGILAILCSTFAAISTEWIYKNEYVNTTIHVQNIAMYTWGIAINWGKYFYSVASDSRGSSPLKGFNTYAWLVVLNYMFLGLAMSVVMKYFTNITKLFIGGASMYVSTFAAVVVFNLMPSLGFCVGLGIVTVAMVLYNFELVEQMLGLSKEAAKETYDAVTPTVLGDNGSEFSTDDNVFERRKSGKSRQTSSSTSSAEMLELK
eukprot:GEMP01001743.1.p1 GENE.GEMP01001743.1~~GEMP01001743.1.p1  ORF type:complete len:375 (+),score=77.94 GEMP01001743.1:215-1339(+)